MSYMVVVSQPMFIPWIGLFEQVRLADTFVHYDDVQLPQGRSFMSRVQIKTLKGTSWLSAPIDHARSGRLICDTWLVPESGWRKQHLEILRHCYARAPYFSAMFELAKEIYDFPNNNLAQFNLHAIELISHWLGLSTKFLCSSQLGIDGSGTHRLVNICRHFGADGYVTGLGALNYLDYSQFEDCGIKVRYMAYQKNIYSQLHGEFTPYVSVLDAVANCGRAAAELLRSDSIYWKDYIAREH